MKRQLIPGILVLLSGLVAWSPGQAALSPAKLALHWHPDTAMEARQLTLAAAVWLEEPGATASQWQQAVHARALNLEQSRRVVPWEWSQLGDGTFGWLVQMREQNLLTTATGFPQPELESAADIMQHSSRDGRLARKSLVAAMEAPSVWNRMKVRLDSAGLDAGDEIGELWQSLAERGGESAADDDVASVHSRAQAERIERLGGLNDLDQRTLLIGELLLAEADFQWQRVRIMPAMWLLYEGLARLSQLDRPHAVANEYADWLSALDEQQIRRMRHVDVDLPVVVALFQDAAAYLASEEVAQQLAIGELADAYARLALFVPDIGFYLDQPVRRVLRSAVDACDPDPLLVGPLPREDFERCLVRLSDLLEYGLGSEELVGGAQGPFAPEFLRRELGLVSWQRAAYLDGYLAWMLEAQCEVPPWVNVLDWSLVAELLARWVPHRPVYFAAARWQDTLAAIQDRMIDHGRKKTEWIDCTTGQGRARRDPVIRVLERHEEAIRDVDRLMQAASDEFRATVVRPGADIDLDGPADQVTAYRPEGLTVGPCPNANSCGARVELPVSRALLGLFPNAFLLADQIGLGELELCYDEVKWVDRTVRPARERDRRVANYHGRLSFELLGSFAGDGEVDTVFRYRLTEPVSRHYLFAANEPELLELECPRGHVGTSVASDLPPDRPGLVPNRLTYFASAPTTPEAQMVANWDRGAEWRDWFITGDRVEQLELAGDHSLKVRVQAQLSALSTRRERQLAAPLINPVRAQETDPLALAMARVTDTTSMIKRTLELHYPRVIRHYDPVRALLAGESGLMTRDRVRSLRDAGIPMLQVPRVGLDRLEALRTEWEMLPAAMRESGHPAPEVDVGMERIDDLAALSRFPAAAAEPTEGQ